MRKRQSAPSQYQRREGRHPSLFECSALEKGQRSGKERGRFDCIDKNASLVKNVISVGHMQKGRLYAVHRAGRAFCRQSDSLH